MKRTFLQKTHYLNLTQPYLDYYNQKTFQNISIPKLPVFTTEEGIKQIRNNLDLIINWKNITSLIPQFYLDNKMKKVNSELEEFKTTTTTLSK